MEPACMVFGIGNTSIGPKIEYEFKAGKDDDHTRCAVKDCRLLFQKASTKTLLYLMAIGQTVAPRSNAPRLNITQYSLFTQVPSGNMRRGVVSGAWTCSFILLATIARSFTCTAPACFMSRHEYHISRGLLAYMKAR